MKLSRACGISSPFILAPIPSLLIYLPLPLSPLHHHSIHWMRWRTSYRWKLNFSFSFLFSFFVFFYTPIDFLTFFLQHDVGWSWSCLPWVSAFWFNSNLSQSPSSASATSPHLPSIHTSITNTVHMYTQPRTDSALQNHNTSLHYLHSSVLSLTVTCVLCKNNYICFWNNYSFFPPWFSLYMCTSHICIFLTRNSERGNFYYSLASWLFSIILLYYVFPLISKERNTIILHSLVAIASLLHSRYSIRFSHLDQYVTSFASCISGIVFHSAAVSLVSVKFYLFYLPFDQL